MKVGNNLVISAMLIVLTALVTGLGLSFATTPEEFCVIETSKFVEWCELFCACNLNYSSMKLECTTVNSLNLSSSFDCTPCFNYKLKPGDVRRICGENLRLNYILTFLAVGAISLTIAIKILVGEYTPEKIR